MGKLIGRLGPAHSTYKFSDCTHVRKGFLNIFTFRVSTLDYLLEVMVRGHAAVVLPIDIEKRTLFLIKQPRFNRAFVNHDEARALLESARSNNSDTSSATVPPESVLVYECPAGVIDPGETAAEAAVRELREETGLSITTDALLEVANYDPSVGGCTEKITAFLARVNGLTPVMEDGGDEEGHESIEVWEFSWDEAYAMLESGELHSASSRILIGQLMQKEMILREDDLNTKVTALEEEVSELRSLLDLSTNK